MAIPAHHTLLHGYLQPRRGGGRQPGVRRGFRRQHLLRDGAAKRVLEPHQCVGLGAVAVRSGRRGGVAGVGADEVDAGTAGVHVDGGAPIETVYATLYAVVANVTRQIG